MATSTVFTAVGNGTQALVPSGSTISYSLSGTFSATMQLVYSTTGGNQWVTITQKTAAASGDYIFESKDGSPALVMWRCISYASGTAVTSFSIASSISTPESDIANLISGLGEYSSVTFDTTFTDKPASWTENGLACSATYNTDGTVATMTKGSKVHTYTYDTSGRLTGVVVA